MCIKDKPFPSPEVGDVYFLDLPFFCNCQSEPGVSRHFFVIYNIIGNKCHSKMLTSQKIDEAGCDKDALGEQYKDPSANFNKNPSYYNNINESAVFTFEDVRNIPLAGKMTPNWITTHPALGFQQIPPTKVYTTHVSTGKRNFPPLIISSVKH